MINARNTFTCFCRHISVRKRQVKLGQRITGSDLNNPNPLRFQEPALSNPEPGGVIRRKNGLVYTNSSGYGVSLLK